MSPRTRPATAPRPSPDSRPGPTTHPRCCCISTTTCNPRSTTPRGTRRCGELTERDGRWFGRGAADCKGNIAAHLTALRALGPDLPVNVKIVGEGSEEQGTGGLENFVPKNVDLLRADAILVADSGNFAVGVPSLTTTLRGIANVVVTVESLGSAMHSGMFGGAAPDALAALIAMLATLRDAEGNTTVRGLDNTATWPGVEYPAEQFRRDATVLDGVDLLGGGHVADMVWARPAATVLGIDCPPVVGSSAAIQPRARARINLRVPPGTNAKVALQALTDHLYAVAPWHVRVSVEPEADGAPFTGSTSGPGYDAMVAAMRAAYGRDPVLQGQGGSIPLCNVFAETYPEAEFMLLGVEEPQCLIHAPNESVDPERDRTHRPRRGRIPAALRRPANQLLTRQVRFGQGSARTAHPSTRRRDETPPVVEPPCQVDRTLTSSARNGLVLY